MDIQQQNGVVVEVAGFQQGFAKRCGRRGVAGEREAPRVKGAAAPPSPLYIGSPRGALALGDGIY